MNYEYKLSRINYNTSKSNAAMFLSTCEDMLQVSKGTCDKRGGTNPQESALNHDT